MASLLKLTDKIDSPLASRFVASRGYYSGDYSPRISYEATVIHSTGPGPLKRFAKGGFTSPLDAAVHIYRHIMRAGPHYVIDQRGNCVQMCPEKLAAWHVGSGGYKRYLRGNWAGKEHGWWFERFPTLKSPLELGGGNLWDGGSCNANVLGIEVIPASLDSSAPWSPKAWSTLTELLRDIRRRRQIPHSRTRTLCHADAHPLARTARGRPYDTTREQWTWDEFARRTGLGTR